MSALFDKNAAMIVVSGLLSNPDILTNSEQYKLTNDDFDSDFYKIIFTAIYNLNNEGVERITPKDLDLYIGQFSKQYKTYKEKKGYEFLQSIYDHSSDIDMARFNLYYKRLKKFTILRNLEKADIDTKEFYNPNVDFIRLEKENKKLNDITIEEILKKVKSKINDVEESYISKDQHSSQRASKNLGALYEELKVTPEIGHQLDGDILNYAVRGARLGKMYMTSAPSGQGKTRQMVGNACSLSLPKIVDGKVQVREELDTVLFVTTEQKVDEIQTLILSYVSGVNERKILYGTASAEEEKLIRMAIKIVETYDNFIIEHIPDPSIALIKTKLLKHIHKNDVAFIFYDYIFSSPGLLGEFRDLKVREDVALMMLSNTLKEIAAENNVFLQTGTQLNERWEQKAVRNVNMIRGSKAIGDKIDVGMIAVKLDESPEELDKIKVICEQIGLPTPNMVVDIYKNRRGEFASVKLFRRFDYGTCRVEDILLTTNTYNVIQDLGKLEYDTQFVDYLDILAQTEEEGEE